MRRAEQQTWCEKIRVVHWVGRVTDEVFSFIGPATSTLAESGVTQTVVAFDDEYCRRLMPSFSENVELVLVPRGSNPMQGWVHSLNTVREVVRLGPVSAIHLHGFLPSLAGALVMPSTGNEPSVYYSPHASKSLSSLRNVGAVIKFFCRPFSNWPEQRMIANMVGEARTLTKMSDQPVELIESPVSDTFFDVQSNEARYPLVLTGSRIPNARSAELMAQIAVLFSDKSLRLGFNWLGAVDARSCLRLRAADVQVYEADETQDRARRLAAGWLYLATGGGRGFPVALVEAMAVGLPCVVLDTPYHRDLIRHGETGFLYSNEDELMGYIAQLVDSKSMRISMGNAARQEARMRFSNEHFRQTLLSTYALTTRMKFG
jgi:glycosyltransferase involved in cell wall biosynthesis